MIIIFCRATVVEGKDVWYQDDGPLSKILCEDVQENHDEQPIALEICCACDEAKYEVRYKMKIYVTFLNYIITIKTNYNFNINKK